MDYTTLSNIKPEAIYTGKKGSINMIVYSKLLIIASVRTTNDNDNIGIFISAIEMSMEGTRNERIAFKNM